jgi:hypothetical protein
VPVGHLELAKKGIGASRNCVQQRVSWCCQAAMGIAGFAKDWAFNFFGEEPFL